MSDMNRTELARALSLEVTSRFHAAGTPQIAPPRLEVEGVGELSYPISPEQAEALLQLATPAPYGRGEQTIVDPEVRKTSQIAPSQIAVRDGERWEEALRGVVDEVRDVLGIGEEVEANLYKMLIYQKGDFFLPHRDTEKEEGMFATLVITLPSSYTGGELVLSHGSALVEHETRVLGGKGLNYIAFYADCLHELCPIRWGYRVALIYNLVKRGGASSSPDDASQDEGEAIGALLQRWQDASEDRSRKLVVPLSHKYTPSALALDALKGEDRRTLELLAKGASLAKFDLGLAMMRMEQTGLAIESYEDEWGEDEDDVEEYEDDEVFDERLMLEAIRLSDTEAMLLRDTLPFSRQELVPPIEEFDDTFEVESREVHEATGNEGATFERSYHRAALVLWPAASRVAIFTQLALEDRFAAIERVVRSGAPLQEEALDVLIEPLVVELEQWEDGAEWRAQSYNTSLESSPEARLARLLELAGLLGERDEEATLLHRLLDGVLTKHPLTAGGLPAFFGALPALDVVEAIEQVHRLIPPFLRDSPRHGAWAVLARHACFLPDDTFHDAVRHAVCSALVEQARPPRWEGDTLRAVLELLVRVGDEELVERFMETSSVEAHWEAMLEALPAALAARDASLLWPLREALLPIARRHLASPPQPPADWRKDASFTPRDEVEREIAAFLRDPIAHVYELRAREHVRKGVERVLLYGRELDLFFQTLKTGSPHLLRITKRHGQYEVDTRRHEMRLKLLSRLENVQVS